MWLNTELIRAKAITTSTQVRVLEKKQSQSQILLAVALANQP